MGRGGSESDPLDSFLARRDQLVAEAKSHPLGAHLPAIRGLYQRVMPWVNMNSPAYDSYSGWKLHIYSVTEEDVEELALRLFKLVEERGMGMKLATPRILAKFAPGNPQRGKGVVIYLPRRATLDDDIAAVVAAVEGYAPQGEIQGSEHVAGPVWKRFDLAQDLGRDVTRQEHDMLYAEAHR